MIFVPNILDREDGDTPGRRRVSFSEAYKATVLNLARDNLEFKRNLTLKTIIQSL
jgi:hypothetical protein